MSAAAVCVPVRADAEGLLTTLRALAALDPPGGDVLVVVAVDGRDNVLAGLARQHGAEVVELGTPSGSYAARNAAVARVGDRADVVAFTDAGCTPAPGWLRAHLDALATADLSGGAVRVTTARRPSPAEWVDAARNLRQQAYVEVDGFAATCNLAVRRGVLERVRFDPTRRSGGDRDFCHRATAAGFRLVYTPRAEVVHPARRTARAVVAKAARVGEGVAALPAASRPVTVPTPSLGTPLVRRAWRTGHRVGPAWAARTALVDLRRARAMATAAGMSAPDPADGLDVVVLLNSRWAALEQFNTRWKQVVRAWAARPDVARLTVADHPWTNRRGFVARRGALARRTASWHPGVEAVEATLPVVADGRAGTVAARRAGGALLRVLGVPCRFRVAVSASPLWNPVLAHVGAHRTGFDAVDDWRGLPVGRRLPDLVRRGYEAAAHLDTRTAVSDRLATALEADHGGRYTPVGNGVDVDGFAAGGPAPPGLPAPPFAVYVGTVQSRVDLDLLEALARRLPRVPVVVAGPADAATSDRLRRGPLRWLGPVPHAAVPGLLHAASVGLLPHHASPLTDSMDPLKLYEYLAAGLPVVATPVSGVHGLSSRVRLAAGVEETVRAVAAACGLPRPAHPDPTLRERSWHAVAGELLCLHAGVDDPGGLRATRAAPAPTAAGGSA